MGPETSLEELDARPAGDAGAEEAHATEMTCRETEHTAEAAGGPSEEVDEAGRAEGAHAAVTAPAGASVGSQLESVIFDLLAAAQLTRGACVLHLGCGDGRTALALAESGHFVDGVDPSNALIGEAKARHEGRCESGGCVAYNVQAIDELELFDQSYNCILATHAIERTASEQWLLRRLFCALRPGGFLIVAVPNRASLSRRGASASDATAEAEVSEERRYVPRAVDHLLRKIGFEILRTESHGLENLQLGRFHMPAMMSRAVEWGIERSSRWALPGPLRDRGDHYVVLAQKPADSGVAARISLTPTLNYGIESFEASQRPEFERLAEWQKTVGRGWDILTRDRVGRSIAQARSAIVLSPHPDDELIGCGGLLLELINRGVTTTVVQMTDGAESAGLQGCDEQLRRTIRSGEAGRVAQEMGVDRLTFLNAPNGRLSSAPVYVDPVNRLLRDSEPDLVLVPFINDDHPDHVAANLVLDDALEGLSHDRNPVVLVYEVWSLVPAHVVHPIDKFMQRKLDLLMQYPTAMRAVDYIWHCQVRNGYRSRRHLQSEGFAEAYLAMQYGTFRRLVQAHRTAGVD